MSSVWKKVPRTIHICACGCGVRVRGTKRRMYAKPYCKYKAYMQRRKDPNWTPDPRFDPRKTKDNPLDNVIPFRLGESLFEDVSSTVQDG